MQTNEFISCALGCGMTGRAIDEFTDNFNVGYSFDDIYETMRMLCQNDASNLQYFNDAFLSDLWWRVVQRYVEKGLDEDLFNCDINGDSCHFYYDGEEVYDADDLDRLVEKQKQMQNE